jgi:hypothetical protein
MRKKVIYSLVALLVLGGVGFFTYQNTSAGPNLDGHGNPIKKQTPTEKVRKESERKPDNVKNPDENFNHAKETKSALKLANSKGIKDPLIKKWAIREYMAAKYYGEEITIDQSIKKAKETVQFEKAWLEVAKEHYGVSVTDEELDKFISENIDPNTVEIQRKFAEGLGITVKELNHEYDSDLNRKLVMLDKLKPKIAEKHGIEGEKNTHNQIIEAYEKEVREYMKAH